VSNRIAGMRLLKAAAVLTGATLPGIALAAEGLSIGPVPLDFVLFALTLLGVALFHDHTLKVAVTGLLVIVAYKLGFTGFKHGDGFSGLGMHFAHEWVTLANMFLLLTGFARLARHFEKTRVPVVLPAIHPDDWQRCFVMLMMVFVI